MHDLAEDRIYDEGDGGVTAYVAAESGVVAVSVAGNQVGRFRMDHRTTARDLAADGPNLVVASEDDVLLRHPGGEYERAGFGPAVAVGIDAGDVVAAGPEGRIGRQVDGEWFEIADLDAAVRAVDGALVGAADGAYRATPDGLEYVGLDDVRDVDAAGPLAASREGLYELGNGWMAVASDPFDAVAVSPAGQRAHAAGEALLARVGSEWRALDVEVPDRVAAIAHAEGTYVITVDGTMLAHAGAGDGVTEDPEADWRTRSLGVEDVGGMAIPGV